jgi:tRNA U34 5-carboxymethylaminomethyl modifying GTPase MnmE/TrmE
MDIINAENDHARKIATRQLSGALKDQLDSYQIKNHGIPFRN